VFRKFVNLSMVLSLGLAIGCAPDKPKGTEPPTGTGSQDGQASNSSAAGSDGSSGGGDAAPSADDPTQKVCDAENSDAPFAFFDDKILIRLPKGVSDENLIEMQPGVARLSSKVDSVSCVEGLPGATINIVNLLRFEDDGSKPLEEWRKEVIFKTFAFPEGTTFEGDKVEGRKMTSEVLVPAGEGAAQGKGLLLLKSGHGFMNVLYMETHPNAWNALKNTFYATTAKMSLLP